MILKILQIIGIFLIAWMGTVNISQIIYKQTVPAMNIILFAIGIVLICLRFIF